IFLAARIWLGTGAGGGPGGSSAMTMGIVAIVIQVIRHRVARCTALGIALLRLHSLLPTNNRLHLTPKLAGTAQLPGSMLRRYERRSTEVRGQDFYIHHFQNRAPSI